MSLEASARAADPGPVVLLYDGGSVFGQLLAANLLAATAARLILVGPDGRPERAAARALDPSGARVSTAVAGLDDPAALLPLMEGITAAVCCVRGFRDLPATLLDACAARRVAYFDIADTRAYLGRILERRTLIAAQEITVGTGLGIVPGLSALMTSYAIAELALYEVARVDVDLYIGSHRARGVGALAAALRCAGRPLAPNVYGWSGRQRVVFPPSIGLRRLYNFDAPDYDLFPDLFAVRPDRVRVRLGFELDIVNRVLWILGLLRRIGFRWRYRGPLIRGLLAASAPLRAVGEDAGAVQVTVRGIASRPGHHAVIRAGTISIVAADARLLMVLPCALAVTGYLAGNQPPGILDWRTWIAPTDMWAALRAHGMTVAWQPS